MQVNQSPYHQARLDAYCQNKLGFGMIKEEGSEGASVVSFSVEANKGNQQSDSSHPSQEEEKDGKAFEFKFERNSDKSGSMEFIPPKKLIGMEEALHEVRRHSESLGGNNLDIK